ncbi:MAG: GntR family transcriptional regulator [Anaerolineae bacterium]|nr:GntR family transcriptional regulator [Anaerolineae bacterium]
MIKFEISKASPLPLHIQLLDDLRHKVLTGVFKPNDMLPGEWELAKELDISRTTIQKAWHSAEEEKLIYRIPGKGTFVTPLQTSNTGVSSPVRTAIGLVIPDFRSALAAQLLRGAERILRQKGYRVQVAASEYSIAEENRVLRHMYDDAVQGFIIWAVHCDSSPRLLSQLSQSVPTVLLDRPLPQLHLPCVTSNNYMGGMQAMQHLIALGHRKIAFLARPHLHLWTVTERYRAFRDALQDIGEQPAAPILIGNDQELSSYDAYLTSSDASLAPLIARLQNPDRPTAIFAVNDWMAMRALRATAAVGLRVPDDLSIVGFDNLEISNALTPPLTTVAQNTDLLGAEAAHRLLNLIDGDSVQEVLSLLPTQLIVRGSTSVVRE